MTTSDAQARQRLVEIALQAARTPMRHTGLCRGECVIEPVCVAYAARQLAGVKDPKKGSWCAAGLTAAMAQAGLLVPAPGTPARRGAIALLDFLHEQRGATTVAQRSVGKIIVPDDWQATIAPGDIIAWLQHPQPDPAGWRRGHVAVIVATDSESITTVGWNEGPSPGRVMMRRLWRDPDRPCAMCAGSGRHHVKTSYGDHVAWTECRKTEPRSSTVVWRRAGGLYRIARPVAA